MAEEENWSAAQRKMVEVWEHHMASEFQRKNVAQTLETMVDDGYVYNVPTACGGSGSGTHRLGTIEDFYAKTFMPSIPADVEVVALSRTVGSNRLCDEILFKFTHDAPIPWLLPGVAPTGKRVEIPVVVIVTFRGDKVTSERIYWDQASVLVQTGLLERGDLPVTGVENVPQLVQFIASES
ncbi:hypothetical protein MPTK1_3g08110 [Marchantia polymorpha subsp. ruderalis]|uniref:SnoaL-like domain-containing protein n=2 Tax=Marchantia polymorpha TaxID=3197 RepID=A0AAF6AYK9_MARPO|nr:hypothetical protein MARPO_0006s0286 [Marchantia polymorpha]BBN04843.1 hypothetical protein Mp_3g08110 [Marchantia polymorpha subsp. ruderalis]|eukprot:PTQ48295.1 hypothetical protein MARPO_0006s0286 [Marchantia polymorpha]